MKPALPSGAARTTCETEEGLVGDRQELYAEYLFDHGSNLQFLPPPGSETHIARFWAVKGREGSHRVVPDGCVDLRLDWKDPGRCVVVAPITSVGSLVLERPYEFVGVRLRPGAARSLLGIPIDELQNSRVPLTDVVSWGDELVNRVGEARSFRGALKQLVRFLLRHIETRALPLNTSLVSACVTMVETRGTMRVEELSDTIGISRGHLHQLFRTHLGVSPKQFARIVRLRSILGAIPRHPEWCRMAAEAGYVDQSHMIAEFRDLVGLTPDEYVRAAATESPT
jgi:AraC-like DNA-binding protein